MADTTIGKTVEAGLDWLIGFDKRPGVLRRTKRRAYRFLFYSFWLPALTTILGLFIAHYGSAWEWFEYDKAITIARMIMIAGMAIQLPILLFITGSKVLIASVIVSSLFKTLTNEQALALVRLYLSFLIWHFSYEEFLVITGVYAPVEAIVIGTVSAVITAIIVWNWEMAVGWGRPLLFGSHIAVLGWAVAVSIPSAFWLSTAGFDLRAKLDLWNPAISQFRLDEVRKAIRAEEYKESGSRLDTIKKQAATDITGAKKELEAFEREHGGDEAFIIKSGKKAKEVVVTSSEKAKNVYDQRHSFGTLKVQNYEAPWFWIIVIPLALFLFIFARKRFKLFCVLIILLMFLIYIW